MPGELRAPGQHCKYRRSSSTLDGTASRVDPDPSRGIVADRIQHAGSCRGFDGGIPAQSRCFEQQVAIPKVNGQVGYGACRLEAIQAGRNLRCEPEPLTVLSQQREDTSESFGQTLGFCGR